MPPPYKHWDRFASEVASGKFQSVCVTCSECSKQAADMIHHTTRCGPFNTTGATAWFVFYAQPRRYSRSTFLAWKAHLGHSRSHIYLHKNIWLFLNNTLCMWSPCTLLLLLDHSYQSWPGFGIHMLVARVWYIIVFMKLHTYSDWDWFKFEMDNWILGLISH